MIGESVLIPELEGVDGLGFDLEGTLYVGDRPVAGAAASIATLRARGMPLRFLTNTTTCAHDALTVKLEGMGFEVSGDEVFCAPTVAGRFLLENDASAWLLVSPAALPDFDGVRTDPDNPDYVVVGDLGDDWTFALLNRAFVLVRERGAGRIGTKPILAVGRWRATRRGALRRSAGVRHGAGRHDLRQAGARHLRDRASHDGATGRIGCHGRRRSDHRRRRRGGSRDADRARTYRQVSGRGRGPE